VQTRRTASRQAVAVRQVVHIRGSSFPRWKQWKELPRFLNTREKHAANIALGIFLLSSITLGVRTWLSHETLLPAIGGSYIEGAIGTPQYINPLYATGSDVDADLTRLLFSGLMRTDRDGALVPDLAESYTVSEDQKTYTFTLRSNALWHDGEPVTSADVLFTIEAIQNPEYHSPLSVSFAGAGITAPDPSTIVITIDEPFSPLLGALTVGILPQHLWSDVVPQNAPLSTWNIKPIGSGPFMFSKLVKDTRGALKSYTLVRNESFYRGTVYLGEFTMKFYGDIYELTDALRNKNIEGASVLSAQDAQSLADDGVIHLGSPRLSQFTAAFFNEKHSTIIANDDIRAALAQATDRTLVAQAATGNLATPIASPILSDMPGFDASTTVPAGDLEGAKALLEAEGWTIAEGATLRAKDGATLSFSITTLDSPDLLAAATELQKQWSALGASVQILTVDQSTLQNDVIKNHDYDVLLAGERYGIYPDLYPFWHSSQTTYPGLNLCGFADRDVDAAIVAARTSTDPQKAVEASQLFVTAFSEAIPAIMLYQPSYVYGVSPKLHNTDVTSVTNPSDRFADVEGWFRKAKRALW
jgi:peptide/nickel transport system substrate-binding protein